MFMYMGPRVWQVKKGWADKIYEEAVVSDSFWVRGSTAMATCPVNALTADGDCDGSINLGFPAVMHINVNALYSLHDAEFAALRSRAEHKYGSVSADLAMFKELVSTDHPLTSKIRRGAQRKTLALQEHHRPGRILFLLSASTSSHLAPKLIPHYHMHEQSQGM